MQSLTGGCEQWLGADTPAGAALTCARGTHRVQMSEHILAALFLCSKDLAGIVLDQPRPAGVAASISRWPAPRSVSLGWGRSASRWRGWRRGSACG
jgi:hypothetical protein